MKHFHLNFCDCVTVHKFIEPQKVVAVVLKTFCQQQFW